MLRHGVMLRHEEKMGLGGNVCNEEKRREENVRN